MKRCIHLAMPLCIVTMVLIALTLEATGAMAATSHQLSSSSCGKWSVVPSPTPNGSSGLSSVATISTTDAWAVGSSGSQLGSGQTVIEHWNGSQWSVMSSPNGSLYNTLTGVSAVSANDVWAVGWQANGGSTQTLIEHWNGSQWSIVPSPSPDSVNNELYAVAALSTNNIWASGFITDITATGPVDQTLTEHWNGSQWSVVQSLGPGSQSNVLSGITTISANDVWAVGYSSNSSSPVWQTLTEHWNGSHWSIVQSPSPGTQINYLTDVAAVSTNDIWAVGYADNQTLTEHWNGSQWSVVSSTGPGSVDNSLLSVAVVSANNVWAVGYSLNSNYVAQTLTEHWNGSHWNVVQSPSPGSNNTQFSGVAAASATDIWAVGHADSNTLIENYHC